MQVYGDAELLQPLLEQHGALLSGELGDGYAAHIKPLVPVGLDQAEHICIVGDPQVAPDLVFSISFALMTITISPGRSVL